MLWIWLAVSVLLGAFGQIFMKIGMSSRGVVPHDAAPIELIEYYISAVISLPMLAAVGCYGLSFLLWLGVLSGKDLSLARPLVSVGYLLTLAYGVWAGEQVTWTRVMGTLLIVVGVFFMIQSGTKAKADSAMEQKTVPTPGASRSEGEAN